MHSHRIDHAGRPFQAVLHEKRARVLVSRRDAANASSTGDGLPARQRCQLGSPCSASGMRAAHSCSACRRLVPAWASLLAEYPAATQAVGGARLRKDEPTLREIFGSDNQIVWQRISSAETGAAVEPPYADSKLSLQIGQLSASWVECTGPLARPSTSSCAHLDAQGSPADASHNSCPPGNCTAWSHPGSRCKPSPGQTVAI